MTEYSFITLLYQYGTELYYNWICFTFSHSEPCPGIGAAARQERWVLIGGHKRGISGAAHVSPEYGIVLRTEYRACSPYPIEEDIKYDIEFEVKT